MESYIKISDRARAPTCVYDVVYVNKKKLVSAMSAMLHM